MNNIKKKLPSIPNQILNRLGFHISRKKDPWFSYVQSRYLENSLNPFNLIAGHLISHGMIETFVQVGANDGIHNDVVYPLLCSFKLRGLLIEPQPGPVAHLRNLHAGNPDIKIIEMAVAEATSSLKLWRACGDGHSKSVKTDALTSFSRPQLEGQLAARGLDLTTESFDVPAASLETILKEHKLYHPNLVVIDTEGMDHLIIKQLNLNTCPPVMIQFESCHMSSNWLEGIRERLKIAGYMFTLTERDVIAVHKNALPLIE